MQAQVFREILSLFLAYVVCVLYVGSIVPQLQHVLASTRGHNKWWACITILPHIKNR
jgi:hypothetical protein